MTTTNLTNAAALALLQLHGPQRLYEEAQIPDADGEHCAPNPESKALWTNGLPDHVAIKERMSALLDAYLKRPPPPFLSERFRYERYYAELHRREREFYAEMHYLDDLLYAAPVLPLPVESTTTIVPYTPAQPRRRGRPRTGIKPRPTTRKGRRKEEDD